MTTEGRLASYGQTLGSYVTFEWRKVQYTNFTVRQYGLTVIGVYYDCKYDPMAKIVFLHVGYDAHQGVVAMDISGDSRNAAFIQKYNALYVATIYENLPVNVEIFDSMIIASMGEKQALLNQIIETPEEFIILGYKDEKLVIPRGKKKAVEGVVAKEDDRERMQAEMHLQEERVEPVGVTDATHKFRSLEG